MPTNDESPNPADLIKEAQELEAGMKSMSDAMKLALDAALESQRLAAAALTDGQSKLAEISQVATQAVAAKTQISADQAVIATKSDHIDGAQKHADSVRADLDRALTAARQQATLAEGETGKAKSSSESAAALLAEIRSVKGKVDADQGAAAVARKNSEESDTRTKSLADKAASIEAKIAAYEARLLDLGSQATAHLKSIGELLPGATAAGLASSFDKRGTSFKNPSTRWQWVFVGSLVLIIAVTGPALYQAGAEKGSCCTLLPLDHAEGVSVLEPALTGPLIVHFLIEGFRPARLTWEPPRHE